MLKPLKNRVIVKTIKRTDKTKSGIILNENTEDKIQFAKVIEIGLATKDKKIEVKKGDIIVYNKYAGIEINYENEEYTIIEQKDILAIVED